MFIEKKGSSVGEDFPLQRQFYFVKKKIAIYFSFFWFFSILCTLKSFHW